MNIITKKISSKTQHENLVDYNKGKEDSTNISVEQIQHKLDTKDDVKWLHKDRYQSIYQYSEPEESGVIDRGEKSCGLMYDNVRYEEEDKTNKQFASISVKTPNQNLDIKDDCEYKPKQREKTFVSQSMYQYNEPQACGEFGSCDNSCKKQSSYECTSTSSYNSRFEASDYQSTNVKACANETATNYHPYYTVDSEMFART